jgi:CubicO group peptidase (beta-lactamase class C family)
MGAMRVSGTLGAALGAAALWLESSLAAGAMTNDAAKARALDQVLDSAVAWKLTPSIAMAVVKDGRIVYADVRGTADLERKHPASVETRYPIGSVGALFVMVGIMQLSALGKLNLDDTVQRYLPEDVPLDVTLRQLLAPQEGDANYDVLASVIERVSGEPVITYLTDRVFRPAGMTHTWLGEPPSWLPLATGYYEWRDVFGLAKPERDAWDRKCCSFVSTAADLARFDAAVLNGTLLSSASLHAMQPHFQSMQKAGILLIGRQGTPAGYDAENILLPKQRFAVVLLANCAGFPAPAVIDRVLGSYYPALGTAFGAIDPNPNITARLRRYLIQEPQSNGLVRAMSFLSSSVSAGSTEYRYLVDFGGVTKAAFFGLNASGNVDGFWIH